ncbi:hypothetical protein SLA2020_318990 [Shorea laevis]
MTPSTTPLATMLSKKFLRDGEIPDSAASATSGTTMEAVSAAAVNRVTSYSLSADALTSSLLPALVLAAAALDGLMGSGLKKASELGALIWLE